MFDVEPKGDWRWQWQERLRLQIQRKLPANSLRSRYYAELYPLSPAFYPGLCLLYAGGGLSPVQAPGGRHRKGLGRWLQANLPTEIKVSS